MVRDEKTGAIAEVGIGDDGPDVEEGPESGKQKSRIRRLVDTVDNVRPTQQGPDCEAHGQNIPDGHDPTACANSQEVPRKLGVE